MRNFLRNASLIFVSTLIVSTAIFAQTSISASGAATQTFDGMAAGLPLPTNWKMSAAGVGTVNLGWADASNVTSASFASNAGTPVAGGRYNWGTTAGTDRAVGVLTDGTYSSPNAIMGWYRNTSGATIHSLTIGFDFERYKVDVSNVSVLFFTSGDGVAWTQQPLATIEANAFAAGSLAYTFGSPTTVSRSLTFNNLNLINNANIYLKWIVINSGNTNAQGIGLDNVTMTVNTPMISASLGDILTDANGNNTANPGEIITYKDTIKNTGLADALSVIIADTTAPAGTTKIDGSTKTSAVAVDDSYTATYNTQLSAVNILTNDFGVPSPQVISYGTTTSGGVTTAAGGAGVTDHGGTVSITALGVLTYTPPLNFVGVDKFMYIAGTGVGLPNNDARVLIAVSPSAISFSTVLVQPLCNAATNGSITVNATGGSGSYLYSKDNGLNFQVSNIFSALGAGTYQIVVKDAISGSTQSSSATLNNPAVVAFTFTKSDVTCNGLSNGTFVFNTATGGTAPYTYSITGAAGTFQASNSFTGLPGGVYTLIVKDNNGCLSPTSSSTVIDPAIVVVNGSTPLTIAYGASMTSSTYTKTGGTGSAANPWSATGLPAGVSINSATGAVSGTPTVTGIFNAVITYTDVNACTGSKNVVINVAPQLTNNSYTAVGNTQLVANGHSTPATPYTLDATNIMANDLSDAAISVTAGTFATTNGGSITIDAAGKFIYTPKVGSNTADAYVYTGTSNGVSATATISFTVSNIVWYVNNTNAAAADGSSAQPFPNVGSAATASAANQIIYVHTGTGSTSGNALLKSGQTLRGAGSALSIGALSIAAGTKPTLSGTVTLANTVSVDGFDMSTGAATAITNAGATVSGITVNVGNITTTSGTGVSVTGTGNTGAMTFASVTTGAAVNAITVTNFASPGSVTINGATVTATTGTAINFAIVGSVALGATTINQTSQTALALNATPVTLNGNLVIATSAGGTGISFGGGSASITAGVNTLSVTNTGAGVGIASTAGTIFITGSNNTISTQTGAALSIANTTVTAGGLTFANVSANGAINGINLNTVTGTGNITIAAGNLVGGAGAPFNVVGGGGSVIYSGSASQATASQPLVNISGGNTGTITFQTGTLSATNGTGLQFDNADGTYNFNGTNTLNGGDAGIDILNGSGGAFTFSNATTITNPTGTGLNIGSAVATSGGGGNVIYGGTISKTSTGRAIEIQSKTGGTVSINGTVSATTSSTGINLSSNTGATINFTAALTLNGTASVFSATGGGTVSSTNVTSTIGNTTPPTVTALTITGTTIGAGGVTFQKINCSGGTKGISVTSTGTGSFIITGTDGADAGTLADAGTGGTIQNVSLRGAEVTGVAIVGLHGMNFLNNVTVDGGTETNCGTDLIGNDNSNCNAAIHLATITTSATLNTITVNGSGQTGINGLSIANLSIDGMEVVNSGNEAQEHGVVFKNLSGINTITNGNFHNNRSRQLYIINTSVTGTVNITKSQFNNSTDLQGVLFDSYNTGNLTVNFGDNTVAGANTVANNYSNGLQQSTGLGGVMNINIKRNTFTNNTSGIVLQAAGVGATSTLNYTISDNTLSTNNTSSSGAIIVSGTQQHQISGDIRGNTIGISGVAGSGASCGGACNGITVDHNDISTDGGGRSDATIVGNTIQRVDGMAIRVLIGRKSKGNVVVTGNLIREPDGVNTFSAMYIQGGIVLADPSCLTATIGGTVTPGAYPSLLANSKNKIEGSWDPSGFQSEIFIWRKGGTLNLPGSTAPYDTFILNRNDILDGTGPKVTISGTMTNGTSCL